MAAVDDEAFFDHSQDHLYDSPNYVGSPMTAGYDSVVAAIEETSVNANDAIFMFVCHKLGGHPRAMVREYTLAKGLPTPKEPEQQSGKRIAQPAPVTAKGYCATLNVLVGLECWPGLAGSRYRLHFLGSDIPSSMLVGDRMDAWKNCPKAWAGHFKVPKADRQ
ncbi:hypothetical protein H257_14916 [Aphanomyces astaci]|uniref:Uncharacterized protein n=1 Tax=Aphanomyces astaci TaxID=112090 RepID=W4FR48_APHAT|nr:hypothetical protein H257_14916 [Aphanomyces astaci]ETV69289.1 hypothetical protein H257_14916 [Aphanomyces astaci]|eukprot:XP_009841146.1 hypothetical protein H257_14916 [Aphanomyces astaci]